MSRPVNPNPVPVTSIIRAKQRNGWIHVQEVVSVYDPKTRNRKRLSTKLLGKLPPGETDLSKMVPVRPRSPKGTRAVDKIIVPMQTVPDSRDPSKVTYPLDVVLCVILLAAMNKLTSCTEIAGFWKVHRNELKRYFDNFPESDISHDAVRRLMMLLGKQNNTQLMALLNDSLAHKFAKPVIAVDGQAENAARINGSDRPPYIFNIMDKDNELFLSQKLIGEKENEITHACQQIEKLNISGSIVTYDALNTQTKFARQIISQGADYCLALRQNHSQLYDHVRGLFELGAESAKVATPVNEDKGSEIETRRLRVLSSNCLLKTVKEQWPGLEDGCLAEAITETVNKADGEITSQVRYYISSLRFDSQYISAVLMSAVRQHWATENKGHWNLDIFFEQDRTQCKNAEYILARCLLNKIAMNFSAKIKDKTLPEGGKFEALSQKEMSVLILEIPELLKWINSCMVK